MPADPLLAGRAFATKLDLDREPDWGPLEAVARLSRMRADLPSLFEGEFMYMACVENKRKGLRIHLYKHIDTRRYLNLDDAGHAYAYCWSPRDEDHAGPGFGGRYRSYRSIAAAVHHLQLWMFDRRVEMVDP